MCHNKRNHSIKIVVDKKDKERIGKKAEDMGLKISSYVRMVSLNAVVTER